MQKNGKESEKNKNTEKLEKHKSDKRCFIGTERVFKIFNRERASSEAGNNKIFGGEREKREKRDKSGTIWQQGEERRDVRKVRKCTQERPVQIFFFCDSQDEVTPANFGRARDDGFSEARGIIRECLYVGNVDLAC